MLIRKFGYFNPGLFELSCFISSCLFKKIYNIADRVTWTNVSDLKGSENEGALRYGVSEIPDNILIDQNGIIVARYINPQDLRTILKEKLAGEASK